MRLIPTKFRGCYLVELERHSDPRGHFMRVFDRSVLQEFNLSCDVDHSAEAYNEYALTLRGLHFQAASFPEAKVVRCLSGELYDVIVDLRPNSPTFCQWQGFHLSAAKDDALFIATGFAHGYLTRAAKTCLQYHIFGSYRSEAQRGIIWNDPNLAIDWPETPQVIGERDQNLPAFYRITQSDLDF